MYSLLVHPTVRVESAIAVFNVRLQIAISQLDLGPIPNYTCSNEKPAN